MTTRKAVLLIGSPRGEQSTSRILGGRLLERLAERGVAAETHFILRAFESEDKAAALFKEMFFDAKKVTSAVDTATRKVLSKFGAYVRTNARHSIRKRKGVSRPGQPPSSQSAMLSRVCFRGARQVMMSAVCSQTSIGVLRGMAVLL